MRNSMRPHTREKRNNLESDRKIGHARKQAIFLFGDADLSVRKVR